MNSIREIADRYKVPRRQIEEFLETGLVKKSEKTKPAKEYFDETVYLSKQYNWTEENFSQLEKYIEFLRDADNYVYILEYADKLNKYLPDRYRTDEQVSKETLSFHTVFIRWVKLKNNVAVIDWNKEPKGKLLWEFMNLFDK